MEWDPARARAVRFVQFELNSKRVVVSLALPLSHPPSNGGSQKVQAYEYSEFVPVAVVAGWSFVGQRRSGEATVLCSWCHHGMNDSLCLSMLILLMEFSAKSHVEVFRSVSMYSYN